MRQERIIQASIFDVFARHEIGRELKAMSQWLDEHRALLGLVAADLRRHGIQETGRQGLPAEAVLRCAAQAASAAELRGAGVSSGGLGVVSRVRPAAVGVVPEEVGAAQDDQRDPRGELGGDQSGAADSARQEKLERGRGPARQHGDAALMHEPSDSSLLWDAVRVMVRLLAGGGMPGRGDRVAQSPSAAKKRALASNTAAAAATGQLYRELIAGDPRDLGHLQQAAAQWP